MCGEILFGSLEDINLHIDQCLLNGPSERPPAMTTSLSSTPSGGAPAATAAATAVASTAVSSAASSSDENDNEDEQSYEVYTIGGIERIRTCSLLEGGSYSSVMQLSKSQIEQEDVDDELDIDDDETSTFGAAQYTIDHLIRHDEDEVVVNIDSVDEPATLIIPSTSTSTTTSSTTSTTSSSAPPTATSSALAVSTTTDSLSAQQDMIHSTANGGAVASLRASEQQQQQGKHLLIEALKAKIRTQVRLQVARTQPPSASNRWLIVACVARRS